MGYPGGFGPITLSLHFVDAVLARFVIVKQCGLGLGCSRQAYGAGSAAVASYVANFLLVIRAVPSSVFSRLADRQLE